MRRALSDRERAAARNWWTSVFPRGAALVAVAAFVAEGADARAMVPSLGRLALFLLLFSLTPLVALVPRRIGWAATVATLAGLFATWNAPRAFQITCLCLPFTVVISHALLRRAPAYLRGVRRAQWGLIQGALPFLAGYTATGDRPGGSALLLALGFFGIQAGAFPLLGPHFAVTPVIEPTPGSRAWTSVALHAGACTTVMILGASCVGAWLWIYGPGITGIVMGAPGGLWLLWLITGWALSSEDRAMLEHSRPGATFGWILLLGAVAFGAVF